jgi:hypothetical protein
VVFGVLASCGDDEPERSAAPVRTVAPEITAAPTAEETAVPRSTAESRGTPESTPQGPPGSEEDSEGGAGDESEQIAVPVRMTIDGEGIKPAEVSVPPTLPFELIVRNDLPGRMSVEIHDLNVAFIVEGGTTYRQRVGGTRKGSYQIEAGHIGVSVLKVGS